MESSTNVTGAVRATHPMFVIAAASVTALSLTGIAVLGGWLPRTSADATPAPSAQVATQAAPAVPAPPAAPFAAPQHSRPMAANAPTAAGTNAANEPKRQADNSMVLRTPPHTARPMRVASPQPNDNGIYVETGRGAQTQPNTQAVAPPVCRECGTVESVREISQAGEGSWIGTVAGGVLGGLLGNQVGRGNGNKVATVAGAVGGAFAGREIEKNVRSGRQYQVTVRFDDGSVRTFTEHEAPIVRNGDRVRTAGGQIEPL